MTNDEQTKGTELMHRATVAGMCNAWRSAEEKIKTAFALIIEAQDTLSTGFPTDYGFAVRRTRHDGCPDFTKPDEVMSELKKQAWRVIIQRIELRRVLSVKRCEELDKQLETGKDLPEIEEKAIWAMLEGTLAQVNIFIEEAVREVFDFLRPRNSEYWNNQQSAAELGNKVILGWMIRAGYGRTFDVNYGRAEDQLRALDNVMHSLDGNGTVKTNRGPLVDAINATEFHVGKGETDYFRFKCYRNGNLHLEFKRPDLVAKINAIVGGLTLKGAKVAA